MSAIGMYMNAFEAMYDLVYMDQSASIELRRWSLPGYDLTVEIAVKEARFAVWGLGAHCQTSSEQGYPPMITLLTLDDEMKGYVGIRYRDPRKDPTPNALLGSRLIASNASFLDGANNTEMVMPDDTPSLGASQDISVKTTWNGAPLPLNYALQACLSTMSYTAQFVKNELLTVFNVGDAMKWVSGYDTERKPLLKACYVWKVMRLLARNMVEENRFGEVDVELRRYEVKIAAAKLQGNEDSRPSNV